MDRPRLLEGQTQKLLMRLLGLLAAIDPQVRQIDLVLELEIALRRAHPDGTGRSSQGGQHALEELAEVIGRGKVQLRQPGDLFKRR